MTASVIRIVVVVAALATISWLGQARAKNRTQSALWGAFSTTSASALFLISGVVGYGLQKGPAIFADSRWTAIRKTDRRLGLK